jgi:hypothetical protein
MNIISKENATVQEEIMNIISNVQSLELSIILTHDDALFVKLHLLDAVSFRLQLLTFRGKNSVSTR